MTTNAYKHKGDYDQTITTTPEPSSWIRILH
jgi:hypothetical protein